VAKFRALCDELNINDWEAANGVLKDILWQAELDDAGTKLWLEAILGDFSTYHSTPSARNFWTSTMMWCGL